MNFVVENFGLKLAKREEKSWRQRVDKWQTGSSPIFANFFPRSSANSLVNIQRGSHICVRCITTWCVFFSLPSLLLIRIRSATIPSFSSVYHKNSIYFGKMLLNRKTALQIFNALNVEIDVPMLQICMTLQILCHCLNPKLMW